MTRADTESGAGCRPISEAVASNEKNSIVKATAKPVDTTAYMEKSAKIPEGSPLSHWVRYMTASMMRPVITTAASPYDSDVPIKPATPVRRPPQLSPRATDVSTMQIITA